MPEDICDCVRGKVPEASAGINELATTLVADSGGEGDNVRGTVPEDISDCVRGKVPKGSAGSASFCCAAACAVAVGAGWVGAVLVA